MLSLLHKLPTCLLVKHPVCKTPAKSVKVSLAEVVPVWVDTPVCVCVLCVYVGEGAVRNFGCLSDTHNTHSLIFEYFKVYCTVDR